MFNVRVFASLLFVWKLISVESYSWYDKYNQNYPDQVATNERRYVDVYTNHPNTRDVIKSYYKPDDLYRYDSFFKTKNGHSQKDVLQSDFGVFQNDNNFINRNDTKNNYNFVFDDEKNLVYLQMLDDYQGNDKNKINSLNQHGGDDDDDDGGFVYVQSQKHVETTPQRPTFKTRKSIKQEFSNNSRRTSKGVSETNETSEQIKSKFNQVLRKYMVRLHKQKDWDRFGEFPTKIGDDRSKFLEVPLQKLKNKTFTFANKLFSLFTIIQFPNSRCVANSASSEYEGTCFHASECTKMNGTAIGNCASGYGVCCVCK